MQLKTKGGGFRPPVIFKQHLPLPRPPEVKPRGKKQPGPNATNEGFDIPEKYGPQDLEENFPCVLVQLLDWNYGAKDEVSTAEVRILAGTYDARRDARGDDDVLNILDRVALCLLEKRILEKRYTLKLPMKCGLVLAQQWPIFFGEMETHWTFRGLSRITDRKEVDITDGTYAGKSDKK